MPEPALAERVWYHLFPLGALGAERHNPAPGASGGERAHRLGGLTVLLDRLVELGGGGLMLGPVFESESHGYDTVDPFTVDRRLGDESDLVALAGACHDRNLALGLDGVFHHVGRGHPRFQQLLHAGPRSDAAGWFHVDPSAPGPDGFAYAAFEGHQQLVKLNHDSPDVQAWARDVIGHWSARGVDAWRIDAAYAIPRDFLAGLRESVRREHPDAWFVGEVIHGDYAGFVRDTGLDTVTQYELWKAIWSSFNDANLYELKHALTRHQEYCASFRPWTFLGNHDTTRIASRLTDGRHLGAAVALLLVLPGTPAVYAGDEVAARGVKRDEAWGDDDVRRPVPPIPSDGPGRAVRDLHRDLIEVRRSLPWLAAAACEFTRITNETGVVTLSSPDGTAHLGLTLGDQGADAPPGTVAAGAQGGTVPGHSWTLRVE